jgi:hypothetical protein
MSMLVEQGWQQVRPGSSRSSGSSKLQAPDKVAPMQGSAAQCGWQQAPRGSLLEKSPVETMPLLSVLAAGRAAAALHGHSSGAVEIRQGKQVRASQQLQLACWSH